jgi:hypothetical protein
LQKAKIMARFYLGRAQAVSQPEFNIRAALLREKIGENIAPDRPGSRARHNKFKAAWKTDYRDTLPRAA